MNEQTRILAIVSHCTPQPGADEVAIESAQRELGIVLPSDYRELLKKSNGLEGFLSEDKYLILWPVQDLKQLNDAYCVNELAPGMLLFGTNGGDTGYGFDEAGARIFASVPLVGMAREHIEPMGNTLEEFLQTMTRR